MHLNIYVNTSSRTPRGPCMFSPCNSSNSSRENTLEVMYSPRSTCSITSSATNLIAFRPQTWPRSIHCCNQATFEFYKFWAMLIFHRLGAKQRLQGKTYLQKCFWWNWWQFRVSCRHQWSTSWSNHQQWETALVAFVQGVSQYPVGHGPLRVRPIHYLQTILLNKCPIKLRTNFYDN